LIESMEKKCWSRSKNQKKTARDINIMPS